VPINHSIRMFEFRH